MNKRGFTLVELLAVISILGVLITLAVFGINPIMKLFGDGYYKTIEGNAKIAGEDYFTDNDNLPKMINEKTKVSIADLVKLGYIEKDIVDDDGNVCAGHVIAQKTNKNYKYKACLECENYKTSDCSLDWDYIEVPDDYYYVWGDDTITLLPAHKYSDKPASGKIINFSNIEVYKNDKFIKKTSDSEETKELIKSFTNNDINEYLIDNNIKIKLSYSGTSDTTNVIVKSDIEESIDKPKITMLDSDNKTYNSNTWINKDVIANYNTKNANTYRCYINDDISDCNNSYSFNNTGTYIFKVKAITKYGTESEFSNPVVIKIDKEVIKINFSHSYTSGSNGWIVSSVDTSATYDASLSKSGVDDTRFKYCESTNGSDCAASNIYNSNTNILYNNDINHYKICFQIKNNAGSTFTNCSNDLKIDKTNPTITSIEKGLCADKKGVNQTNRISGCGLDNEHVYGNTFKFSDNMSGIDKVLYSYCYIEDDKCTYTDNAIKNASRSIWFNDGNRLLNTTRTLAFKYNTTKGVKTIIYIYDKAGNYTTSNIYTYSW